MIGTTHANADDFWHAVVRALLTEGHQTPGVDDPTSPGSSFGIAPRQTFELIGTTFLLANPQSRIINSKIRGMNRASAAAYAIWTLTGSDDLEAIAFYNPRGKAFSDDGHTLAAAPGARIFQSSDGDQFALVAERLKRDPVSRRAVIAMYSPKDTANNSRDVSCTATVQFLWREEKLHCIVHMRSQSAYGVLPYDLFTFTLIHEAMATRVGMALGTYTMFCGSLHIYEDELDDARKALIAYAPCPRVPMRAMSSFSETDRELLIEAEAEARRAIQSDPECRIDLSSSSLDSYWKTLLNIAIKGAQARILGKPAHPETSRCVS